MLQLPAREQSYWLDTSAKPVYPQLKGAVEVDVVVVGGGISGLSTAYLLRQAGKSVAVLEKGTIAGSTTGHTTGKVTSQHGLTYSGLYERLGEKTARLYADANQTGVEQIENLVKKEKISCGWQKTDNYVYTRSTSLVAEFKKEAKIAQKLNLPAECISNTPLPFGVKAAVRFADQARFNAAEYAAALASKINGAGSFVFENTRAINIHDGHWGMVETPAGVVVAKDIVIATNVPTFPLLARAGYCLLEYPQTSYIVAARTSKSFSGMYISPDEGEYSVLPLGKLVLIGGESHIRGARLNKWTRYQRLADYAEERFGSGSVEYVWKAWDYHSYDDVPLVGRLYPWSEHLYVVSAFRKWGLSHSMVTAIILRDLICNQPNEWTEVYNPNRLSPVRSIPHVAAKYL